MMDGDPKVQSPLLQHKQIVAQFLERFSAGDIRGAAKMMQDDAVWIVMGQLDGMSGRYARDQFIPLAEGAKDFYAHGCLIIEPQLMTAEADRVSVVAQGHAPLKDGRIYAPSYHFLIRLKDGKIAEVREYMDTLHAKEIFFAS